ncbi:MAG: hypothetical protein ABSG68_17935 [Thermoguttaceae bacterium]|jgi:hypothetical protein
MRRITAVLTCAAVLGAMLGVAPTGGAERLPRKAARDAPLDAKLQAEMKALVGKWVGASYDYNGRTDIPLKKSETLTISLKAFDIPAPPFGPPQFREMFRAPLIMDQFVRPAIQDLEPPSRENLWGMAGGTIPIGLDVSKEPHLAFCVVPGPGQKPMFPPGIPDMSGGVAYSLQGDALKLRFLWKNEKRAGSLTAKKGTPNIVFHLNRAVQSASESERESTSASGSAHELETRPH